LYYRVATTPGKQGNPGYEKNFREFGSRSLVASVFILILIHSVQINP